VPLSGFHVTETQLQREFWIIIIIIIIITGVDRRLTQFLQTVGENAKSAVRVGQVLGEWLNTSIGM
jgi:hypothetical protein